MVSEDNRKIVRRGEIQDEIGMLTERYKRQRSEQRTLVEFIDIFMYPGRQHKKHYIARHSS